MKASRIITACVTAVLFTASFSYADIYQWVDQDGVLHMVDSLKNVPQEYRDKVKIYKSRPPAQQKEERLSPEETLAPAGREQNVELYGDHPLEWWKETFNKKRQDLQEAQDGYRAKKQFIDLVDSGTRLGQIYGTEDVEKYNRYMKELPDDEKKIQAIKDDLAELVRKATIFGVPRNIRGE